MSFQLAHGTVSSGGIITTTEANQEFDFSDNFLNTIFIKAGADDITVKFNSETTEHPISAGDALNVTDLQIRKITIVENGVEVQYYGTFI